RRRAGRLHDEYVASAHVLHELDVDLAVAEAPDVDAPERGLEALGDVLRQRRVRIACEQRERVAGTFVGRAHNCCAARAVHRPCMRPRATRRARSQKLAGGEGFEPPNGGIKTRCLTTWRHPSTRRSYQSAPLRMGGGRASYAASPTPRVPEKLVERGAVEAPRHEAPPAIGHPPREPLRLGGALERREDTRAGAREVRGSDAREPL